MIYLFYVFIYLSLHIFFIIILFLLSLLKYWNKVMGGTHLQYIPLFILNLWSCISRLSRWMDGLSCTTEGTATSVIAASFLMHYRCKQQKVSFEQKNSTNLPARSSHKLLLKNNLHKLQSFLIKQGLTSYLQFTIHRGHEQWRGLHVWSDDVNNTPHVLVVRL